MEQLKRIGKINYSRQQAVEETRIRRKIENLVKALSSMDPDKVISIYAPDVVSFDVEGTYQGAGEKRKAWTNIFSIVEPPLKYEIRDLNITVGGGVAFSHSYNRLCGTLKNGQQIGPWVRYTACFRKIDGDWLIAHEQVSLHFDFESGRTSEDQHPSFAGRAGLIV